MEQVSQKVKNIKLINLRCLAIIIVVLGHSIILFSHGWNFIPCYQENSFYHYLKEYINLIQMPLFFSLSGYLFSKKSNFQIMMNKKARRLFIPYLFVAFLFMIPAKIISGYKGWDDYSLIMALKRTFLLQDEGHLWFLPTLFIFFIIEWLIYTENKKLQIIIFFIALFFCFIPYSLDIKYFYEVKTYFVWFYLGSIFKTCNLADKSCNYKLLSFLSIIIFCILSTLLVFQPDLRWSVMILIKTITILCFLYATYLLLPSKTTTWLILLDDFSFGIYLFHMPFIYLIFSISKNINTWLIPPFCILFSVTFSIIIVRLVRILRIRVLIGE